MKVIVVGAGISGLSAAKQLIDQGHIVLLLEAQASLGGRVKTVRNSAGRCYDLGASWFHDSANNVLYDIALQNAWPLVFDGGKVQMFKPRFDSADNKFEEIHGFEETLKMCDDIPAQIGSDDASDHDMSLEAFALSKLSLSDALPIKAYEHFVGLNWKDISAVETPPFLLNHGEDAFQLGGNQLLIDWLVSECTRALNKNSGADLCIKLNSPVSQIQRISDHTVRVITSNSNEVYECSKVIVTASLGVLKENHEQLFPDPLPRPLRHAMTSSSMASLAKIVLEFPYQFWSSDLRRAEILGKTPLFLTNAYESICDGGPPALVVLVAPPLSIEIEAFANVDATAAAASATATSTASMSKVWQYIKPELHAIAHGVSIPDPSNIWVSNWSQNQWTRGSYSALSVGQNMRDFVLPMIQGAWDGQLLFAGEHTTIHGAGCMDGAYVSGIRAARQVENEI